MVAVFLSVKSGMLLLQKNITIAGACSGLMGTTIGIGGPPMAIVYQNSTAKNAVATLNMFFGIGALFSVLLLVYIDLINLREYEKFNVGTNTNNWNIFWKKKIIKNYVNINLKISFDYLFFSALIVLIQAFI